MFGDGPSAQIDDGFTAFDKRGGEDPDRDPGHLALRFCQGNTLASPSFQYSGQPPNSIPDYLKHGRPPSQVLPFRWPLLSVASATGSKCDCTQRWPPCCSPGTPSGGQAPDPGALGNNASMQGPGFAVPSPLPSRWHRPGLSPLYRSWRSLRGIHPVTGGKSATGQSMAQFVAVWADFACVKYRVCCHGVTSKKVARSSGL